MNNLCSASRLDFLTGPEKSYTLPRVLLVHTANVNPERTVEVARATGAEVESLALRPGFNLSEKRFEVLILQAQSARELEGVLAGLRHAGMDSPVLLVSETHAEPRLDFDGGVLLSLSDSTDPAEFRSRMNALVQVALQQPYVLEIADLRIDTLRRKVERAGHEIVLTPREFGLLELLVSQRGTVISRRKILTQVFHISGGHSSNVVDVYVRTLRKKIDEGHATKLIQTRRGFGYLVDEEKAS